jgi:hypothetical protein
MSYFKAQSAVDYFVIKLKDRLLCLLYDNICDIIQQQWKAMIKN